MGFLEVPPIFKGHIMSNNKANESGNTLTRLSEDIQSHMDKVGALASKSSSEDDIRKLKDTNEELIRRLQHSVMPSNQKAQFLSELEIYNGVFKRLLPTSTPKLKF